MPKPIKKHRISGQSDSVQEQSRDRALEQARRVPWPRLVNAVDQYNDWQVFGLWLRAVVDAAGSIPTLVARELETRIPGFLPPLRQDSPAPLQDKPGHHLWNLVDSWVNTNVLLEANVGGWLDAVHYFASMSLAYMKAWAHWEQVDAEWRRDPPAEWPTYPQWQEEVAAVSCLPNPAGAPQQVLDAVRRVPAAEWQRMRSAFFELIAFSLWMELILDLEGPGSKLVADELAKRYRGFGFTSLDLPSSEAVRELNSWAVDHAIGAKDEKVLAALSWHVQHNPGYYALRNYAVHCHDTWPYDYPSRLPSFEDWRQVTENSAV
jgi:hypothetical protein